ncbi:protein kinase [Nocardiopsis mangrovi]|uniref:Protein kinase n=1 Tax=Nocardiopsis mangrovi TaxID=1179818 RepID=A0ABV9DQW0_9ACTN
MSDLPGPDFRSLIQQHSGDVADIRRTERGFMSDITAVVESEKGTFFVKAMKNKPGGRLDSLSRERLVNPAVHGISPHLLWYAEDEAWAVLGFEYIEGRHADITPGSPDLAAVTDVIDRIGRLELPDVAKDWRETRWDRFAENAAAEAELFAGDALLYTDIHPSNVIIGAESVWAVDWAWPTRGAAFIDPALLVLQLVAAGHTPAEAESWADRCDAWVTADPVAVDAFAAATVRMYTVFTERKPDSAWLRAMANAARSWTEHRGVKVSPPE